VTYIEQWKAQSGPQGCIFARQHILVLECSYCETRMTDGKVAAGGEAGAL
jgi:hypothetical protein